MEIKVTNFTLIDHFKNPNIDSSNFILPALNEFKKCKMIVSVASKIVKNISTVNTALLECDKIRIVIAESLCERDGDKPVTVVNNGVSKYKFSDEGYKEFNEKWVQLLNTEITIDITPINELDIENLEVNVACYQTLVRHGFIKEKE